MDNLTDQARQRLQQIAQQHGVSNDAAYTILMAVNNGGGTQAQFNHPELGGGGQWMSGGMTMVGDMFNNGLKAKVDGLCSSASQMLAEMSIFKPRPPQQQQQGMGGGQQQSQGGGQFQSQGGMGMGMGFGQPNPANQWWPTELGQPSSSGGQNDLRYAIFPGARRLAVQIGGQVTVYDTLDHQIGGVSQQQSGGAPGVAFSSQLGTFTANQLPVVSGGGGASAPSPAAPAPAAAAHSSAVGPASPPAGANQSEILDTLERLGRLREAGVLSEDEFASKKEKNALHQEWVCRENAARSRATRNDGSGDGASLSGLVGAAGRAVGEAGGRAGSCGARSV